MIAEVVQAKSRPEFPLLALAYLLLRATERPRDRVCHVLSTLELCESLGQLLLVVDPGDPVVLETERAPRLLALVAWVRCEESRLSAEMDSDDISAVARLGHKELTGGPVLFVVEFLAVQPRLAYRLTRQLARLPGVKRVAGWRRGRLANVRA